MLCRCNFKHKKKQIHFSDPETKVNILEIYLYYKNKHVLKMQSTPFLNIPKALCRHFHVPSIHAFVEAESQ